MCGRVVSRPSVSVKTKRALIKQAGEKCANPGCSARRTHLHHIRKWEVYRTHDAEHMIAVCPTCHDSIHHGSLPLDDKTLYRWKNLRDEPVEGGHLYVEPGGPPGYMLGSLVVRGNTGVSVFEMSEQHSLGLRVEDGDLVLVDFSLSTSDGLRVASGRAGHVKVLEPDFVRFHQRPGRIRIQTDVSERYLPDWVQPKLNAAKGPTWPTDPLVLLDAEVVRQGLVRVEGVWAAEDSAVLVDGQALWFVGDRAIGLTGAGEATILNWGGPPEQSMFGFVQEQFG